MSVRRRAPPPVAPHIAHAQRLQLSLLNVPQQPIDVSMEERNRLYGLEGRPSKRADESQQMYEIHMVVRRLKRLYGEGEAPNGPARVAAAVKHYIDDQDSLTLLENPGPLLEEVRAAFVAEEARKASYLARVAQLQAQLIVETQQYDYWSALKDMLIAGGGKANQASSMSRDPEKATAAKDRMDALKAELGAAEAAEAPYIFDGVQIFP